MVGSKILHGAQLCRVLIACLLVALAAGCSTSTPDGVDQVLAPKLPQPRLWTGEQAPASFWMNVDQFNGGSEVIGGARVDYIGELNDDRSYSGSPAERGEIELIRQVGSQRSDLSGTVTLNFENDSLEYVVQQMLGGLLGLNYIAAGPLNGTVSFRTETPIARSQVLAVVRSLLAQHNLSIKVISGIMHIGSPEQIAGIEQITGQASSADAVMRVVRFEGGIDPSLVESLGAILPEGAAAALAPDERNIILRAPPESIDSVENLVRSFAVRDGGRNLYAIIHLQHSAPEAVAAQLTAFFSNPSMRGNLMPRSIIPLDSRQALLVSASNEAAIENVKRMASHLDFNLEDEVRLRIIPLRHATAETLAEQIGSMFSSDMTASISKSGTPSTSEPASAEPGPASGNAGRQSGSGGAPALVPAQKLNLGDKVFEDGPDTSFPRMEVRGGEASREDRVQQAFDQQSADTPAAPATVSVQGGGGVSIVADNRNNALLIRSSYQQFKRIREAVAVLDIPLGQVVIEATILEVKITDALRYGVQWYLSGSGFSMRNSSTTGVDGSSLNGFVTSVEQLVGGISINAVIDALDDVTEVHVVSSPYLTVMDRKTARLVVGDQIPFSTKSQSSSSSGDVAVTQEIELRDTGVILEVTPIIRADNSVELTIQQEVSSADMASGTSTLTPTVTTRSINSDVIVSSGHTILLGGLIQDRKDDLRTGIPGLRKAPLIGKLFEQTSQSEIRTEVVVLITPRVSRRPSDIERITDQLRQQLGLSGGFPDMPQPIGLK